LGSCEPSGGQPPTPSAAEIEARIARVEAGLLGPVQIAGRDPDPFLLLDRLAFHRVPGVSVAVIHGGRIEWARGYGLADIGSDRPVTTETLFQAASMSKPVAALAALRLVEEGRIDLDEDVGGRLTSWRVPRDEPYRDAPVTLRRLLTHTAGLTVDGFRGYAEGERVPSVVQVLDGFEPANSAAVRVDIEPGTRWRYSGGGYTVVQQLVEDVTGRGFEGVMREVLDALDMRTSTYEQPLPEELRDAAAKGYRADGTPVVGAWHTYPEKAAAGLWTTPSDLARYALEVGAWLEGADDGVLSPAMTSEMLTAGLNGWGLGPKLEGSGSDLQFGHGGANEGFRGGFIAYPRRGLGAVVMTNGDSGEPLVQEILYAIAAAYDWPGYAPRTVQGLPMNADQARPYIGGYRLAEAPDMEVTIRWRNGRLELRVGDRPASELVPTGSDRFLIMTDGSWLRFERDGSGRIVAANAYGSRATKLPAP
jgi:CubicO group peptidase (beta-lactamase class C family)